MPHGEIVAFRSSRALSKYREAAAVADSPRAISLGDQPMSTLLKNKSLLLLPVGLAILVVIGILTS